jgi:hypothetical protein
VALEIPLKREQNITSGGRFIKCYSRKPTEKNDE